MPCIDIEGFNPSEFYEQYIAHSNPEVVELFTRPQRPCRKFDIHSNDAICYYERKKIGEITVGTTMPQLSKILGIPRITNAQIRPTSIRRMKKAGIEDRVIMELTGQKDVDTLRNYDPLPDNSVKIQRSLAILGSKAKTTSETTSTIAQVHSAASSMSSSTTILRDQK